jgi:hypothetical protein
MVREKEEKAVDSTKNDKLKISTRYTNDFTKKVKALQARFAGKNRRALYNMLKEKGVISKHYTVEMWDNDFKAWRKNPNNGIFRHLEMVCAILDEAQMPAFQVFGGPHARDTDVIIKGVVSGIKTYIKNPLNGHNEQANSTRINEDIETNVRIINGDAFKNMIEVHELIETHWLSPDMKYCSNLDNSAFFFLYAWTDLEAKMKEPRMHEFYNCINTLAYKILNTKLTPYYYGYFSNPYNGKQFQFNPWNFLSDADYAFDNLLNQSLIIAYQLNYIIHVYDFFYERKTITSTYKPPKISKEEEPPANLTYQDSLNKVEDDTTTDVYADFAQFSRISDIDKKSIIKLVVNKQQMEDSTNDPKEIMKQRLQEIKEVFMIIFKSLSNIEFKEICTLPYLQQDKYEDLLANKLNTAIRFFQDVMKCLNGSHPSFSKILASHSFIIDDKKPKELWKGSIVFSISQKMLDELEQNLNNLKKILNIINIKSFEEILSEAINGTLDIAEEMRDRQLEKEGINNTSTQEPPSNEQIPKKEIDFNEMKVRDKDGNIIKPIFINPNKKETST